MKKNELSCNRDCTGCKLCGYVCPQNAISFIKDEIGFEYPIIDENKCIDCKRCIRTCPINSNMKNKNIAVYAAINKNIDILSKSASGGVFSALATYVISNGGVVYGSSIQKNDKDILKVSHVRIDKIEEIAKIQGSKYVQSDMNSIFAKIKKDLDNKSIVLFSGTPCQTAAIRSNFGNRDNLVLVDIICHGVPSQQMFSDYLKMLGSKNRIVENFLFRIKDNGWGLCAQLITKNLKGKIIKSRIPCNISSYYKMFLRCEIYRESCYSCKYATRDRVGDLTLGDYWGVEKIPNVYDKCKSNNIDITKGISCVIASSEKGEFFLKNSQLMLIESDYESVAKENGQLHHPSPCPETRKSILNMYKNKGYIELEKYFKKTLGKKKYIILLRNRISPRIRMKVKMLLRK